MCEAKRCRLLVAHLHSRLLGRVLLLAPVGVQVAPSRPWAVSVPRSANGLLYVDLPLDQHLDSLLVGLGRRLLLLDSTEQYVR